MGLVPGARLRPGQGAGPGDRRDGRQATASGRADRDQGRAVDARSRHDGRVADPGGVHAGLHRHLRRAPGGGRRRGDRQDQHGRVRDGVEHRELRVPAHPQPVGHRPGAGWLERRFGLRCRGVSGAVVARDRYRGIHPPAGGALRDRRDEAHLRGGLPLRAHRVRFLARPGRTVRPHGPRRGAPAVVHGRPRRSRLHLARMGRADRPAHSRAPGRAPGRGRGGADGGGRGAGRPGGGRAGPRAGGGPRWDRRADHAAVERARTGDVLPHRPRGVLGQPRPVRRGALRAARRRGVADRPVRAHARRPVRARGQAADHAGHVRARVGVLRRVLPAGAEGSDADRRRLRPGVRGGRPPRVADVAHRRVPARSAHGGPVLHVPGGRLHDPRQPRGAPGDLHPVWSR